MKVETLLSSARHWKRSPGIRSAKPYGAGNARPAERSCEFQPAIVGIPSGCFDAAFDRGEVEQPANSLFNLAHPLIMAFIHSSSRSSSHILFAFFSAMAASGSGSNKRTREEMEAAEAKGKEPVVEAPAADVPGSDSDSDSDYVPPSPKRDRRMDLLATRLEAAADDLADRRRLQEVIERDFTLDRLRPAFRKLKELADGHGLLPRVDPPLEEKMNHYAPKVEQLAGIVLKALAKKDDASAEEEEEDED